MKRPGLMVLEVLIVLALVFGIMMTLQKVRGQTTSGDWLAVVAEIDRAIEDADKAGRVLKHIDAEDRKFVRKMANVLTAEDNAVPTAAQARWLRSIREWVRE